MPRRHLDKSQCQLYFEQITRSLTLNGTEVDVNGLGEVLAVRIDKELFGRGDQELLEYLLPAAFNAAHRKAKELYQEAMQELSGDMNLPGLGDALAKFTGQPPTA